MYTLQYRVLPKLSSLCERISGGVRYGHFAPCGVPAVSRQRHLDVESKGHSWDGVSPQMVWPLVASQQAEQQLEDVERGLRAGTNEGVGRGEARR